MAVNDVSNGYIHLQLTTQAFFMGFKPLQRVNTVADRLDKLVYPFVEMPSHRPSDLFPKPENRRPYLVQGAVLIPTPINFAPLTDVENASNGVMPCSTISSSSTGDIVKSLKGVPSVCPQR